MSPAKPLHNLATNQPPISLTVVSSLIEVGKLREIRKFVGKNVGHEAYENVYRFFYENIHKCQRFDNGKVESAIVLIASYMYRNSWIIDPEINFAALCIELDQL